mmetsp:Transcript_3907/g.8163  ORF Transcript_3907/g.8163 Transcript_3907/m.8163 type:complete len:159 (+) Transcript_3907:853-1329(+)
MVNGKSNTIILLECPRRRDKSLARKKSDNSSPCGMIFSLWNDALLTGDSDAVTKRYAKGAVLLPTVSDIPRTTYEGIKDYFDHFLELKPEGKIVEGYVSIGENWCKDVGIYEFKKGTDGSIVRARYSFVYVFEDGQWKISHHHSSLMPEELLAKAKKA